MRFGNTLEIRDRDEAIREVEIALAADPDSQTRPVSLLSP